MRFSLYLIRARSPRTHSTIVCQSQRTTTHAVVTASGLSPLLGHHFSPSPRWLSHSISHWILRLARAPCRVAFHPCSGVRARLRGCFFPLHPPKILRDRWNPFWPLPFLLLVRRHHCVKISQPSSFCLPLHPPEPIFVVLRHVPVLPPQHLSSMPLVPKQLPC